MSSTFGRHLRSGAAPWARLAFAAAVWAGALACAEGPAAAQPYYTYDVGAGPRSIVAADLNRDGRPDLLTANISSGSVSVLLNRGAGRFERLPDLVVNGASRATAADLDGDSELDLVVAGTALSIFPGRGDGTFGPGAHYDSAAYYSCVTVGDVNRDGTPDVVAGESVDRVAVYPGHGDGTLGPAAHYNANPGDAVATTPLSNGPSATGPPRTMKLVMITGVAIGDLNGDGWPEIAVSLDDFIGHYGLEILIGNGDGTFRQADPFYDSGCSWSITTADFNRDSWLDLAAGNWNHTVSLVMNPANGTVGSPTYIPTRSSPVGTAAGDLNRDGAADLVTSNYPGEICVWLNDGTGGFLPPVYFGTSEVPNSIAIADLDADGRADVATADETWDLVAVLFGDGSGGFGAPPTLGVPEATRPGTFALQAAHPNPMRAQAAIRYSLPGGGRATLRVLDTAGRLVFTLQDGFMPAGDHVATWSGRRLDGAAATPGVYICELRFEGRGLFRKLTVLR
jgi:hypothetical protein